MGGENQIIMIDSHDLPKDLIYSNRLTSKRDNCCVERVNILIDEYDTSADVRIGKYDSAYVRVDKYNLPSNRISLTVTT